MQVLGPWYSGAGVCMSWVPGIVELVCACPGSLVVELVCAGPGSLV